jgi:hypothetical protein
VQPDIARPMKRFLCPENLPRHRARYNRRETCSRRRIVITGLRAEDRPQWNQLRRTNCGEVQAAPPVDDRLARFNGFIRYDYPLG